MQSALQTLQRCYSWKLRNLEPDATETLHTAGYLANTLRKLGRFSDSARFYRDLIPRQRRVFGDEDRKTLESRWQLAIVHVCLGEIDDAQTLRDAVLPVARRVLGPENAITRSLQRQRFLDPSYWAEQHAQVLSG